MHVCLFFFFFLHVCLYEDVKSPGTGVTVVNCWQNSHTGFLTCDMRAIMVGKAKWKPFTLSLSGKIVTQKWTAATLQPLSETALKDTPEKGSLHSGQNFGKHTFCFEREMARCTIVHWIHRLWPLDWLDGQGFRKSITWKLVKRISQEGVCTVWSLYVWNMISPNGKTRWKYK